ncbi:hypothetical protein [Kitasatospora sp. NBC_01266]|uniref:hypothetical protein n=1 Tax=Kitasatospora sp. NBC_01266 TaxID=2903572 RepID=UPI002E2F3D99|nr:hypothetical protein [Kitasatospora sp. NBC_01266]
MTDDTPRRPFDHDAALNELRALGKQLDRQVTTGIGTSAAELDATLAAMRAVHHRIEANLRRSLAAVSSRRTAAPRPAHAA